MYSPDQISELMSLTASLSPPLFAASMHTLIGLLAATGLRGGEAAALDVEDLDVDEGVLSVCGKYGKRRLVPLHPTTVDALACYYHEQRATRAAPTGPLLVAAKGGRLNINTARAAFRSIANTARLPARPGCGTPRLHDLRHTFAVNSLIDAHRHGVDVDARIAALAAYLGHAEPANTYWYLTASPELMAIVSQRTAAHRARRPQR